ncbi:MAG: tetraacyldisaccharide 4'-kinase, partial [Proteobacteria bacterium]|nr:tetraacyldisaccharide 4'-kinase [Pseudomonadota bacterium]
MAGPRPVDHKWFLAPLWAEARPRAVLFVEGCWWPQLARLAASQGVPVIRVSAKAGPRTRRAPTWWYRRFTAATTLVIARDAHEAQWFANHQASPVCVGGDLKGDRPLPANPLHWPRPYVVGASLRGKDAKWLIEADLGVGLLLAPRYPSDFDDDLLIGKKWVRRSQLPQGRVPVDTEILLLDTLGELAGCFDGAKAAFIGGTFDPNVGGHSPLEAARAGVPVVAGPHIFSQPSAFLDAGAQVVSSVEELGPALKEAISALRPRRWTNNAGRETAKALGPYLLKGGAPETSPRPWALPLAPWYGLVSGAHHQLWELGVRRFHRLPVPVVSVGSTNARGSGKTPATRWMAEELRLRGHVVGIAIRGYRRKIAGKAVILSTNCADADHLGDEGALLARDFLVAASPDRFKAGLELVQAGATVVVLDDGLQHRRLHRDIDLVIVDARFSQARGLIPCGERREWRVVPRRATGVIVEHGGEGERVVDWTDLPVAFAERIHGPWHCGHHPAAPPYGEVAAFAGIARPADFLSSLELPVARFRGLRDHQAIDGHLAAELRKWAAGRPLVCTAKDWVRLPEPLRSEVWWRDVLLRVKN